MVSNGNSTDMHSNDSGQQPQTKKIKLTPGFHSAPTTLPIAAAQNLVLWNQVIADVHRDLTKRVTGKEARTAILRAQHLVVRSLLLAEGGRAIEVCGMYKDWDSSRGVSIGILAPETSGSGKTKVRQVWLLDSYLLLDTCQLEIVPLFSL